MKTLSFFLGLLFTGLLATAQDNLGVTVTVTIENMLSDDGKVTASLHSQETFMKGPGIKNVEAEAKKGEVTLTFENVEPGTFAIMVLHDKNENNRMDFDENGMPKENYGMSGNEMLMGPPTFESAKFEVASEDLTLNIRF
ncbi:DUF2141 domain-containing protein [Allomuricauda sp. SCSIO 65647]|uniref:DUF2141 domain-containing protein n=1 Tax=Allomuricauda sp. SCSIO 65647 TaxID=2908843 RepID=UPI001F3E80C0|nr:DUF2141 domain-containing protein [Muricauda sp. SCSIO 65647]UJH67776.1 DUF2141 domain-containing protein [Muricauda sp. SCSIO 65647]